MNIIELLEQYTKEKPSAQILFDEAHSKGISYAQMDDISGRVYRWLKNKGLGKEDFVLINLPRGLQPVLAMIGVWKAGAAWALVEDTYAPERIRFISKDCGCKVEIDSEIWNEIMREEPLYGHEEMDPHDAAYAVYTSGTTGNPKGVLHEFGNLQLAIDSININGESPFDASERVAVLAPMNFVATVIVILKALSVFCGKTYIVSYATIKNPMALKRFFLEKRITVTFLTPSYVRMLGNQTGPFLRMLFVGSEPANNIYNKNVDLINIYAASESGFAVSVFQIDRSYEVCPVGKPSVDIKVMLLDENGNEVPEGEIGELCFEDPYVRGYINLPEETEKAFQNRIFHSGDLGRKEPDGNYVLLGRSGDMIKINGNRIEPAEIEAAFKETVKIRWAAARGFEIRGKSFLCAYYMEDVHFDAEQVRKELLKRLPYYMIPAFFIKIKEIPLKANGKMDRKALPEPDLSNFQESYVAPRNPVEEKLVTAMAKVLHLEKVGIKDDFYEIGGDSLASMNMITECDLPGLNASQIFRGRCAEKIAKLYEKDQAKGDGDSPKKINAKSLKQEHPLTTEQIYMVDYQLYAPNSTMYNLFSMMRVDKEQFELERMVKAITVAIKSHPALLTTFAWNEDGEIVQRYTPERLPEIHIEKVTEFEFNYIKDVLVYPFKIVGGNLFRCRVFETEKAGYIFFDVHHSLFDGTSLKVFMGDVVKAFMGMPIDEDYYYYMLAQREAALSTPFYEESRQYFEKRYDGVDWNCHPKKDHESREYEMGELFADLGIESAQLAAMERSYKISRNEFFITVLGLAIAFYNDVTDVKIAWIYNGREDRQMMSSVGLLFRDLPVAFRFHDTDKIRDIFAEVDDQVQRGIEHSCYPYVEINEQHGGEESAYLLYQQDIRDMGGLEEFDVEAIEIRQNQAATQTILDVEVLDGAEGLVLMIDFAASLYETSSIERFKDIFVKIAQALATHNAQADLTVEELRDKIEDKKNFFSVLTGIFRTKR